MKTLRVCGVVILINQRVVILVGADLVIKNFVKLVFTRIRCARVLWFIIARIIEPLTGPGYSANLHPIYRIRQILMGLQIHDFDLLPIATGLRQHISRETRVFGRHESAQTRGAVGRELVGIEQNFGRSVQTLNPQNRLILQALVFAKKGQIAFLEGRRVFGIIVDFAHARAQLRAKRNLIEVAKGDFIFGLDPCLRRGRAVVFEPIVGVANGSAEVIVRHIDFGGRGIGIGLNQHNGRRGVANIKATCGFLLLNRTR